MPLEPTIPSLAFLIQFVIYGLMFGVIYSLFALGLTVVFSISKIVNFAHGEFYMLGGYFFYFITTVIGVPSFLAPPLAVAMAVPASLIVERTIIRPVYTKNIDRPDEYGLIVTFGLLILLQNLVLQVAGPWYRRPPPFWDTLLTVGPFTFFGDRVIASIISVISLGLLFVFFTRTWLGRAMRAAAQHRMGAQTVGISLSRMGTLSFLLGASLAALAGSLLAHYFSVFPAAGQAPAVKGFVIIVLGGLGSVGGAALGGILLGLFESGATAFLGSDYTAAYGFALMILILALRPHGMFGEKVRRV